MEEHSSPKTVYLVLRLDAATVEAVKDAAQHFKTAYNRPPREILLHPAAVGKRVGEITKVAEELGLEVKRSPGVLSWEVWVGG